MKKQPNSKLEYIKRRKAAQGIGTFPGMGRNTAPFKDKKKEASRNFCRGKDY